MSRKQKIIVSVTGIFIVLLILVGLTYAYFLTQISGNTNSKSISVTTADLKLVYGDGNGILEPSEKLLPEQKVMFNSTDDFKSFTVTNNGNNTVEDYVVVLENVYNELSRPQDLVYTVECTSSKGTDCNGVDYERQFPTGSGTVDAGEGFGIVAVNTIEENEVQTYKIRMKYLEPGVDQSDDMNKTIQAKINISNFQNINYGVYKQIFNNGALATNFLIEKYVDPSSIEYGECESEIDCINKGYYQAILKKAEERLFKVPTFDLAKTINYSNYDGYAMSDEYLQVMNINNGIGVNNDDYGLTYYFSGNVVNNYLSFNNMCWQILRVQGDGTIKVVLVDSENVCSESTESRNNTIQLSLSSRNNFLAKFDENIKKYMQVNNWCTGNGTVWKDEKGNIQNWEEENLGLMLLYSDSYFRVSKNKEYTNLCLNKGYLTEANYIGTITIDELYYSGYTFNSFLGKIYNVDSNSKILITQYASNGAYEFYADLSGSLGDDFTNNIVPVIVLKNNLELNGDGTKSNPYTIK